MNEHDHKGRKECEKRAQDGRRLGDVAIWRGKWMLDDESRHEGRPDTNLDGDDEHASEGQTSNEGEGRAEQEATDDDQDAQEEYMHGDQLEYESTIVQLYDEQHHQCTHGKAGQVQPQSRVQLGKLTVEGKSRCKEWYHISKNNEDLAEGYRDMSRRTVDPCLKQNSPQR